MTSRLKTIELQGYKTFANKVDFEFPLPITAIVGPNGSGKSNISDAIRWVLGEQSFSLLRGRKTMDMIFSGSDKKARASMASATILFDNSDQWLPIDYQEVSITRRAFRDGQNEYLVNGQKVRLKDVNELLAQSGLSERTYTIIGQGLIDNALSAKPDDRRKFFEEAAGIGLFRSRREEALTRLTDTRHNMERIGDILSELEPRVHSLERQAKRAAEYERVSADLKILLRDWYGYHWHKAQQELLLARDRNLAQENKTSQIREELSGLENNTANLQEEVRSSRLQLSELHNQSSEAHRKLEKYNRDTAILDERLHSIQNQITTFQEESENLNEESELIDERKGELAAELADLQSNANEAQTQKNQFEQELTTRQEELRKLKDELREKRAQLTKIETEQIRAKARRDELTDRSENLNGSLGNLQTALEKTEADILSFKAENNKVLSEHAESEAKLIELNQKAESLKAELEHCETQQRELSTQKSKTEAELSRSMARYDVLNDAERNLSGLNQGAQFLMKHAKNGRISSKIRSLEGRIVVPKEYELAVAAALGENLDALVLDRKEWNFVMDLLNSGSNGRAILMSEDFSLSTGLLHGNSALSDAKSVAELIECDEQTRSLLQRVLGNTWLIEDRSQALRLQAELLPGQSLVTLNGELFRANGSVIAGNEGKHQLLSRTREMQELLSETRRLKELSEDYSRQLTELDKHLKDVRSEHESASKERSQLQQFLTQIQKKINQITIESEKRNQTIAFQRQRLEESQHQIAEIAIQIESCQEQIAALEKQHTVSQNEIRNAQNVVNQIQLNELQDQVHHWNVSLAVLQKSIIEINTRVRENEDQLLKNRNRQTSNSDRIYALEKQIEEINEQKEEIETEAAELTALTAQLSDQISPAEVLQKEAEERLQQAQEAYLNFQQRVSSAERFLAQTQLDLTRQDDKLESLKKRIEDDFGLVNFTFKDQISGQSALPLGEMVSDLPQVNELQDQIDDQIQQHKNHLRRMGAVNFEAVDEYKETSERCKFLQTQLADLQKADNDLRQVIAELDSMMENSFQNTFDKVQKEFKVMFTRLFGGGSAKLLLTDPEDVNSSGIEIEAKLPGHREQELSLLSGGERSLTSVALVFALLRVSPTPFCVLDEVDAALDEANVGRFCELLKELSKDTQFLVITHNRNTVEASDVIYGITMASDSTSQVVSLKLDEVSKDILK